MPSKVTFSILDFSNETSTVGIWLPQLSSANFDIVSGDAVGENVGDLRVAMNGLILGNHLRRTVVGVVHNDVATLPTDASAQRERKVRIVYRDTVTTELGAIEIPTADYDALATQGTDVVDITAGAMATFVTALENNAVSRDGNAIQVVSAQLVGRNI